MGGDAPQWQDVEGNEVDKAFALGHPVKYKLVYPDLILYMDKSGDNGNQSDDKAIKGCKVVCETIQKHSLPSTVLPMTLLGLPRGLHP